MRVALVAFVAATSLAAIEARAATELRIGTAASTKSDVSGTLAGNRRLLKLGDGVFQNEDIATGDAASAQILFTDETALTMGPNSRVILDKLVYDPSQKKGELVLRATTGAFRFVSGSGPKRGYKIDTPMGTIGVRGTIIHFTIQGQWLTLSLTEGGTSICTKSGRCADLDRPGTYVVTNGSELGSTKSNSDKSCSEGSKSCKVGDSGDTLFIDFLGLRPIPNDVTPAAGPGGTPPQPPQPPTPPNPPPPPTDNGFPPIQTGAGTIPPGLQRDTLPPGLANRGPSFLPPGQSKRH